VLQDRPVAHFIGRHGATLRRVLAEPRLRRVESAFFAFGAAEYGVWVAILVYVYAYERGGATLAGVIAVVQLIPAAVVAPLATRIAERLSRGAALHLGYGTLAISLSATAAVLLLKAPAPVVYAGAVVAASAVTLIRPAQSALLPDLVSEPADLTAANVITGWVESGSLLIGPAIAGLMIGFDGPGAAVALFAVAIVLATILVAPLGGRSRETDFEAEQADDAGTVLAQLRGDSAVTLLLALVGVQFIALGALDVLEIVLAVHVLAIGPSGAGYLGAAFGAGSMIGATGTIGLVGRNHLAGTVLGGAAAIGVAFVAFGVWPTVAGAFTLLCGVGAAHAALDVASRTMFHRVVPDALRRHVFGLQEGLGMLGLAFGSIAVPPLVHAGGAEAALCAVGGLLIAVAAVAAPRLTAVERAAAGTNRRALGPDAVTAVRDARGARARGPGACARPTHRRRRRDGCPRGRHRRTLLSDCGWGAGCLGRRPLHPDDGPRRELRRDRAAGRWGPHGHRDGSRAGNAVRAAPRALPRGSYRVLGGPSCGGGDGHRQAGRDGSLGFSIGMTV